MPSGVSELELEGGGRTTFVPELDIVCTCGGKVSFGRCEEQEAVLHSVPECKQFTELDVLDFLTMLRKHYQKETGVQWP